MGDTARLDSGPNENAARRRRFLWQDRVRSVCRPRCLPVSRLAENYATGCILAKSAGDRDGGFTQSRVSPFTERPRTGEAEILKNAIVS